MSDLLKKLHEQRMGHVENMRAIAERGFADAEDEASYDKSNEEVTKLGKLILDESRAITHEKEQAEALEAALRTHGIPKAHELRTDEGEARKTWDGEIKRILREGDNVAQMSRTMPLPTYLGPNMRAALEAETRTQNAAPLTAAGSATTGPELVPTNLVEELFIKLFDDSGVLAAGPRVIRTDSGNPLLFPRLTSLSTLSQAQARVAEAGAILESEPTFDQVTLNAYKYGQYSKASTESFQDASFDIASIMGQVLGRNLANYFGQELLTGSGSSLPRGLTAVVGSNVVTGGTGVTGGFGSGAATNDQVGQLLDVIQLLKPQYRKGAKWLLNDATMGKIRKFQAVATGTVVNNYLWAPAAAPGLDDSILGFPAIVDPFMANMGLGVVSVIFANFDYYYVRLVNEVRIEASTQVAFLNDQIVIRAILRGDADSIDDSAFCGFKGGAS